MRKARKCATCGKPIEGQAGRVPPSFCSERCRMVDLGKWLEGEYRIPGPPATEHELMDELREQPREEDVDE
jgi:uncharacterized protein